MSYVERGFPAADDDDALSVEDRRLLVVLGVNHKTLEGAGNLRNLGRLVQAGADRDAIKGLNRPVGQRRPVTPPRSGDVVDARVPHAPHEVVLDRVTVEVRDVVVEALVRLDLRTQP